MIILPEVRLVTFVKFDVCCKSRKHLNIQENVELALRLAGEEEEELNAARHSSQVNKYYITIITD